MRRFIALFLNIGLVHNLALGDGYTQVVEINQDLTYKITLAHKADLSTNDFCLEVVKLGSDSSISTKYDISNTPKLNDLKLQKELLDALSQKIKNIEEGQLPSPEDVKELISSIVTIDIAKPLTESKGIIEAIAEISSLEETSVSEAEKQGNELVFETKEAFLDKTKEDICGRKTLKFNGIDLDEEFFEHFCETVYGEFQEISFENCPLTEGVTFAEILDSCNVVKLSITNCGIIEKDLKEVLIRINPYCISDIKVAGKPLNVDVVGRLKQEFGYRFCLDSFEFLTSPTSEK